MTLSIKFFMGYVVAHALIWLGHLFAVAVKGGSLECESGGNRYLCGSPIAASAEWMDSTPNFFLFNIVEFFADFAEKVRLLIVLDYALLRDGDGLVATVGDGLSLFSIVAFFAITGSFIYQRLTR